MRIIGGKYRGKKLYSPETDGVRPTSDRAREAVFNILNSKLEDEFSEYNMLDVFAGTGAMGLEGLSRGMKSVAFIDLDIRNLKRNVGLFPNEKDKIRVISQDASKLAVAANKYDIVFLDAPYKKGLTFKALEELSAKGWLKPGAWCLAEIEKGEKLEAPEGFEIFDDRKYGLARIIFLKYSGF